MGRKSHEKINIGIIILALFLLGSAFCLLGGMRAQESAAQERIARIAIRHPELTGELVGAEEGKYRLKGLDEEYTREEIARLQQELKEKYQYHAMDFRSSRLLLVTGLLLTFLGAVALIAVRCGQKSREKRREEELDRELEAVRECLEAYQDGRYLTSLPENLKYCGRIAEPIRELGLHFADVKERAKQEEQNTKALITNISHQLKTPLASLKMSCELADCQELTEEEREDFLQHAGVELEKLEDLLNIFVSLSRLENQMIQLKPQKASLRETVTAAVNGVIMKACQKNIEISFTMEEEIWGQYDKRWINEALVNLLDNGIKYSPPGSRIRIGVQKTSHYALLEIEDEGIGISRNEYHKIFQRFYRGQEAAKMCEEGAGVGLYLARMIIERQGGTIRVKSKMGGGTLFQVMLPSIEKEKLPAAACSRDNRM